MSPDGRRAGPPVGARACLFLLLAMAPGCRSATYGVPAPPRASGRQAGAANTSIATTVIGSAGGTVALPGGAKIVVPSDAFRSPTTVSFREVPLPSNVRIPPGTVRVGKSYTVQPRVTAARPVAVTLPYDPTLLPAGYEEGSVSIYQLRSNGQLSMVGSDTGDPYSESAGQDLDVDNNLVTVLVRSPATYTVLAIRD